MIDAFAAEAWSYLGIALVVISLRIYFKWSTVGWRKMTSDDALMVCAGLVYTAETTTAHVAVFYWLGLANNNITDEHRATLDPNSEEWRLRVNGSKTHVIGWFTYTAVMWLLKTCWILYYSHMVENLNTMKIRIKIGYVFLGSTYIASICMIFFKCWPLERQWQIYPNPGNNCQPGFSKLQVLFIMALNTATDLYLMAIPIPIIYKTRIEIKKKLLLLILFGGGFIVMIFGILRCVTLVTVGANSPSQSGQWSVRESFVAILVCNGPMVFPLFRRWLRKARGLGTHGSNSHDSYPLGANANRYHGQNSSRSNTLSRPRRPSHKFQHPLSIPNDTAWGSDDAIVVAEQGGKSVGEDQSSAASTSGLNSKMSKDGLDTGTKQSSGR
ncbi:hypothetical protein DM02DRAFT_252867 [Periconia macrospinosa]|uniref:Rhodopsin domain-containing protein n=1 Tax=Periconia macrospinosa TaxID=97972 RepID=A0A2V1D4M7_9PLEO|nr:hypothetical protein DM02DRAFT_252867 [Periconia macrospinosa]